jgi:hypothetical protein
MLPRLFPFPQQKNVSSDNVDGKVGPALAQLALHTCMPACEQPVLTLCRPLWRVWR